MSQGTEYLRAVVQAKDKGSLRRIQRVLFTEDELPIYDAAMAHMDRHNAVPSARALVLAGHTLPILRHDEPVTWYEERLRRRAAYNAVNERHPRLVELMQSRNVGEIESLLREMLTAVSSVSHTSSYRDLNTVMTEVLEEHTRARRRVGLAGISLKWPTLNAVTHGAQGGDVIVFAGRPGTGKSWTILALAHHTASLGHRTAFVSMEMGLRQITRRWMGIETGVNPNDMRTGTLSGWAEQDLRDYAAQPADHVMLMAGDMSKEVAGVEALVADFRPEILFVDAAYLLSPSNRGKSYIAKWESVSMVIAQLKQIGLRYDIPVVITVQFNRNVRKGSRSEPDSADVGGSDSVPQDASILVGSQHGPAPHENTMRVHTVMKNRDGEQPRFATEFRFSPVSMEEVPMPADNPQTGPSQEVGDADWT